jgi:hypothetical protein
MDMHLDLIRRLSISRNIWRDAPRSNPLIVAVLSVATVLTVLGAGLASPARARASEVIPIAAHNVLGGSYECDGTEWHFVINQIDDATDAPATILVVWANSSAEDVPLSKVTGGVAHYTTSSNLDSTVISATAVIYAGWSGQFNLSHCPCAAPSTNTPIPAETPQATDTPQASETPDEPVTRGHENTPTPEATATLPVGAATEVPSTNTPTTSPVQSTATQPVAGVVELPNTGAAPHTNGNAGGSVLAAVLLASVLAGSAVLARRLATFGRR